MPPSWMKREPFLQEVHETHLDLGMPLGLSSTFIRDFFDMDELSEISLSCVSYLGLGASRAKEDDASDSFEDDSEGD